MRESHGQVATLLRAAGGSVGYTEVQASGELCELAKGGDRAKLSTLLASGCDVNAADYDKRTSLHLASSVGNLSIVEELLARNADVNAKDRYAVHTHHSPLRATTPLLPLWLLTDSSATNWVRVQ